ncbi:MAG: cyclic pyranopterin monophosphate synthase MoaC [Chthonomonadales bacterium]
MENLTHLDGSGQARMVPVGHKATTERTATARASVILSPATIRLLKDGKVPKGDVFAAARIAGIMAAKRTSELIPLCHQVALSHVEVHLDVLDDRVEIEAHASTVDRTGVEMEALTAVTLAALTVYDMVKAVDRSAVVHSIRLVSKSGGRSGTFLRSDDEPSAPMNGSGKESMR